MTVPHPPLFTMIERGHFDGLAYQGRRELSREEPAIRGWFVPPVVIPIVIAVVVAGYCSFRAFFEAATSS